MKNQLKDELLTTAQVADLFKVSQLTVRRWCATGVLPAIKFGHEWRISKKRLNRLIQERMNRRQEDTSADSEPDSPQE